MSTAAAAAAIVSGGPRAVQQHDMLLAPSNLAALASGSPPLSITNQSERARPPAQIVQSLSRGSHFLAHGRRDPLISPSKMAADFARPKCAIVAEAHLM